LKIAVLADPHANLIALKEVLSKIEEINTDEVVIAGDIVGYGPYPKEVIQIIRNNEPQVIRGNHDKDIVGRDFSWMNSLAAQAAEWTAAILDEGSLAYLGGLQAELEIEIEGRRIGIYHGSPEDPNEYVMDESRARHLLMRSAMDIVICGHTHVPLLVSEKDKIFLNPGGIGQPRDGNPEAAFATIDLTDLDVKLYRVPYDIPLVQRKMIKEGLPQFLALRLAMGY